jgi:hypothetical protein
MLHILSIFTARAVCLEESAHQGHAEASGALAAAHRWGFLDKKE